MRMHAHRWLGGLLALAVMMAFPVPAHADTYVAGSDSRTFADNQGGWSGSSSSAGLCIETLVCPAVTNGYVASGGVSSGGDGYIRTQFGSLASTLAGTSTGVWRSPAFVYRGRDGRRPGRVNLDLSIRPRVGALLGLELLNDSSYRVDLVDQSTGAAVSAVPETALTEDSGWTAVPTASVNPRLLKIGRAYRIRITTTYHSAVAVIASGEVGYDNVRLTTRPKPGLGGNGGGNGGSGITTIRELKILVSTVGLPGSVKLVRNTVKFRVKCPAKASPKVCKYKVQGLSKARHSAPATTRKFVKVKPGGVRIVKLRVKPKYLATYRNAKRITLKTKVRVGEVRTVVVKRVKLIR